MSPGPSLELAEAPRGPKRARARVADRTWIACDEFTAADIMMAGVLRNVRKTDLLDPFPKTKAYRDRCFSRPAWERTLTMYAQRFGVSAESIR